MMAPRGDKRPRKSLKRRLIFQISSLVAIAMLLVVGLVAYLVSENLRNQMIKQLEGTTRSSQQLLEQRLDYLLESTERLTTNPFVINGLVDAEGRESYLPKLAESFAKGRDVLSFILVDYDGRPLFQTEENVPAYNESSELRTALARGKRSLFVQRPENHLVIVAPIDYYDTTQGAVIIAFNLAAISQHYLRHDPLAYHRLLIGAQQIDEHNFDDQIDYLTYRATSGEESPLLQQVGIELEIGLPKASYLAPVWEDVIRLILLSLLFVITAVMVSTWIGNSIAQPIITLHRRVQKVGVAGGEQCSPLGTNDELEELALAFDQRTSELTAAQRELETDIAARTKAQSEIDHLRHYLQNIIDSMPSMLIGVDEEGRITHWNQQAETFSGIDAAQAQGQGLAQVMPMLSAQMERVRQAIKEHQPQTITRQIQNVEGESHYSDITIYPLVANAAVGAVIRVDDITERVRMEEMMMQTEKMMSVGGLAAGMAHEINNPLGGILQGLQNIRRRLSPELKANKLVADALHIELSDLHAYMEQRQILHFMDEMADAGQRASDIVSNMLAFSRKAEMKLEAQEVNQLIDRTLDLAAVDYDLKKKYDFRTIEIVRDFDESLPPVKCIGTEIQQVLLNLLRNAAQALQRLTERSEPARITVRTGSVNGYILIEVEDNGPGMDDTVRARVFEPFFTTRPVGEGTGLGLSVSYFIIHDEHGGQMSVESQLGEGATFIIKLPTTTSGTHGV